LLRIEAQQNPGMGKLLEKQAHFFPPAALQFVGCSLARLGNQQANEASRLLAEIFSLDVAVKAAGLQPRGPGIEQFFLVVADHVKSALVQRCHWRWSSAERNDYLG